MLRTSLSVLGRLMLVAIFLMSALGNKISNFSGTVAYMTSEGVPIPSISLVGAIAFLILGGASIATGYKTRVGAALLIVFLAMATYFFHDFWTFESGSKEFQTQMIQFLKNVGLAGGLLFIAANGPGLGSLDRLKADPVSKSKHE